MDVTEILKAGREGSDIPSGTLTREIMDEWARRNKEFVQPEGGLDVPGHYAANGRGLAPGAYAVRVPHAVFSLDKQTISGVLSHHLGRERAEAYHGRVRDMARLSAGRALDVGATPAGFHHEVFDESAFQEVLQATANLLGEIYYMPSMMYQNFVSVIGTGAAGAGVTSDEATTAMAESTNPTFANVEWKYKTYYSYMPSSRQFIETSMYAYAEVLKLMGDAMANKIDRDIIHGNGTTEIEGLDGVTGIDRILAAAGDNALAAPDYQDLIEMRENMGTNNAPQGSSIFTSRESVMWNLKGRTRHGTGTEKEILEWNGAMGRYMIDGSRYVPDNNIQKSFAKGTESAADGIFFANFMDYAMGFFNAVDLIIDPYTEALKSTVRLILRQPLDAHPRVKGNYTKMTDLNISL